MMIVLLFRVDICSGGNSRCLYFRLPPAQHITAPRRRRSFTAAAFHRHRHPAIHPSNVISSILLHLVSVRRVVDRPLLGLYIKCYIIYICVCVNNNILYYYTYRYSFIRGRVISVKILQWTLSPWYNIMYSIE